jgi:hypothetical protein
VCGYYSWLGFFASRVANDARFATDTTKDVASGRAMTVVMLNKFDESKCKKTRPFLVGVARLAAACSQKISKLSNQIAVTTVAFSCLVGFSPVQAASLTASWSGAPFSLVGDLRSNTELEIEVTDDFTVTDISVNLTMYAWSLNYTDISLVAPDGTSFKFLEDICRGRAVTYGHRGYDKTAIGDGSDVTTGSETLATYSFADTGGIPLNDTCTTMRWDISRLPGSWEQLPPGAYPASKGGVVKSDSLAGSGALPQATFAEIFDGKDAKGTWKIIIQKWADGKTFLDTESTYDDLKPHPLTFVKFSAASITFGSSNIELAGRAEVLARNFMVSRASRLLSEDLNLQSKLRSRTDKKPSYVASYTPDVLNLGLSTSLIGNDNSLFGNLGSDMEFDIWTQGSYHKSKNPSGYVEEFIGHLGVEKRLNENLLVGALLTIDHADQSGASNGDAIKGTGWLVGPYLVSRLHENVIFDGRLQYGQTSNDITLYQTVGQNVDRYDGSFETHRLLAKAQITGDFMVEELLFEPSLAVAYTQDQTDGGGFDLTSGTNTNMYSIDQITISEGRLTLGQRVSREFVVNNYTYIPSMKVSGIWQFDQPDYYESAGVASDNAGAIARFEMGLGALNDNGFGFGGSVYYEGIGGNDHQQAYGGSVSAVWNF